jgi:hypothetical protein
MARLPRMAGPTEFFRWYITDERTGKRRLTRYAMTREQAAERFPDSEPDLRTREVRDLPEPRAVRWARWSAIWAGVAVVVAIGAAIIAAGQP